MFKRFISKLLSSFVLIISIWPVYNSTMRDVVYEKLWSCGFIFANMFPYI